MTAILVVPTLPGGAVMSGKIMSASRSGLGAALQCKYVANASPAEILIGCLSQFPSGSRSSVTRESDYTYPPSSTFSSCRHLMSDNVT